MYMCEFRTGSPTRSKYMARKWVQLVPQRKDIVRLDGQMYTISRRYIGMDDHIVLFITPAPEVLGNKLWVFPRRRKYAREDD